LHLLRSILRSEVFLVIEAKIIGFSDFTVPVLVDQILEVDSSLLANLALEVLVHLTISGNLKYGGDAALLPLGLLNELGRLPTKVVVGVGDVQACTTEVVEEVWVLPIDVQWLKYVGSHLNKRTYFLF